MFCTCLTEQPRQDTNLLYRLDESNEPTKEGPHSFVLYKSPIASISTVSRGHTSGLSVYARHEQTHSDTDRQSRQNYSKEKADYLNNFLNFLLRLLGDRIVWSAAQVLANLKHSSCLN
jgi:hypothetical protein